MYVSLCESELYEAVDSPQGPKYDRHELLRIHPVLLLEFGLG